MNRFTPLTLLAALVFTCLAAPALAQLSGGTEGRRYDFVADPDGAAIHFATAWFGEGESIWRAEHKVDLADLQAGVEMVDKGLEYVPTTLYTSYTGTTLSGTTYYGDANAFERASDNELDFMVGFKLETSCSVNCLVTGLTLLTANDIETDFESPTQSIYELGFESTVTGISGDHVEFQNPH